MDTQPLTCESAWRNLMSRLIAPDDPAPLATSITLHYCRVCEAYGTPPRAYHNLTHIAECLALFREFSQLVEDPIHVEFAIWLHDCIYDARRGDNEERSADVAGEIALSLGLPDPRSQRIRRLIQATRHQEPPADPAEALLVDIDLAILGAPPARYDEYSTAIRAEYAHVDEATYRRGRADFLRSFVQRPVIYHTPELSGRFDLGARKNLRRELSALLGQC